MKAYGEFRPTRVDSKDLGLEDRQDWLVVGLAQNRDSGCLERCNFAVALDLINKAALGDEGGSVEVHRFGHWGPGWFDLILVRPASRAFNEARDVEAALADYPVLDDDRHNEMAQQEADALWAQGKVVYQVAFVAKDHLIHYDARLSAKAAIELAAEMNRLKQDEGAKHFVIAVEADQ